MHHDRRGPAAGAHRRRALEQQSHGRADAHPARPASLGRYGLVQPLLVRRQGEGFETIAGAQRLEALAVLPAEVVQAILPQSLDHLRALSDLPRIAAEAPQRMAEQLAAAGRTWEAAKALAFDRISFACTTEQRQAVDGAVEQALGRVVGDDPNPRGAALALVCAEWAAGQRRGAVHRAV